MNDIQLRNRLTNILTTYITENQASQVTITVNYISTNSPEITILIEKVSQL